MSLASFFDRQKLETEQLIKLINDKYAEACTIDDDLFKMRAIPDVKRIAVLSDLEQTHYNLEEVAARNDLTHAMTARIVAERIVENNVNFLRRVDVKRIIPQDDIITPLLLVDVLETIWRRQDLTIISLCSVNILALSAAEAIIAMALLKLCATESDAAEFLESSIKEEPPEYAIQLRQIQGYVARPVFLLEDHAGMALDEEIKNQKKAVAAEVNEMHAAGIEMCNRLQMTYKLPGIKYDKYHPVPNMSDELTALTRDLKRSCTGSFLPPATGEDLYRMITQDVRKNMEVFVMKNDPMDPDVKIEAGTLMDFSTGAGSASNFTVRINREPGATITVTRAQLAYGKPNKAVDLPVGTRVFAYLMNRNRSENLHLRANKFLPGTVGAVSNLDPKHQYLIFFDCDQEAYIERHLVCLSFYQAIIEDPTALERARVETTENFRMCLDRQRQEFLRRYLSADFNETAHFVHEANPGTTLAAKYSRKMYQATVIKIDRDLLLLRFRKNDRNADSVVLKCTETDCKIHNHIEEWVYRGSTTKFNLKDKDVTAHRRNRIQQKEKEKEKMEMEMRAEKPVTYPQTCRKSSAPRQADPLKRNTQTDGKEILERINKSLKLTQRTLTTPDWPRLLDYKPHGSCSKDCWTNLIDVVARNRPDWPKDVSPFLHPMILGWCRTVINFRSQQCSNGRNYIIYVAPCGRRFHRLRDIRVYLNLTEMPLIIFKFNLSPHFDPYLLCELPSEFSSAVVDANFSLGMEDVDIPVINTVDDQERPRMVYNTVRFAREPNVERILTDAKTYRSCCSCQDDCADPDACDCQRLTREEHSRLNEQLQTKFPLYENGMAKFKVQSGIYECNSLCMCNKSKCLNTVAQRKISIPLQLFQTAQSGWGVRTLVNIPQGSFISTYMGEVLADANAEDKDVDTYFAELDLIDVFENEKSQRGIDLPDDGIEEDASPKIRDPELINGLNLVAYFRRNHTEELFIIDAFEEGNIGRFYNHSCDPNLFVQNIFMDTHDLRLPNVAFFAARDIKAGEQLTWDYGYYDLARDIPCYCGSNKCRGILM